MDWDEIIEKLGKQLPDNHKKNIETSQLVGYREIIEGL